jgi:hypothetical protein
VNIAASTGITASIPNASPTAVATMPPYLAISFIIRYQ